MLRVFSVILVLILSPTNLASFDEVWDKYFDFYSEVLEAPFLIEVNNTVEDDCWTNIEAARKAIWEPLSEMGIETARATYNYIELSVDGYREGRTCFGNIQIYRYELNLNELFLVTIKTDMPIAFESYKDCAPLGGFILIDKISKNTVGVGMIEFALRRASNIQKQKFKINNLKRNQLNGHKSQVLWFTGLSGSGKSTIANALEKKLYARGVRTYILDGDNVRRSLNSDLGFTDADRIENIRRIGEVAKLMLDAGIVVLVSLISPFRAERKMVRELFKEGEFKEIFVDIPLATAEKRDPKGLYKKARDGKIPNFTGIGSPYEKPQKPDIHVKTEFNTVNEIVEKILKKLEI